MLIVEAFPAVKMRYVKGDDGIPQEQVLLLILSRSSGDVRPSINFCYRSFIIIDLVQ